MTHTKIAAAGMLVFAGLVVAALTATVQPDAVFAGRMASSPVGASGQLVTQVTPLGENRQQYVVIEPDLHVMAVYHIDAAGEIVLKSVRNFHWDLQMEQFNGTSPLPREIRSQIDQH
ncbi:MAG TPA: hypothetical protein VHY91_11215 [Pirellulales bacterium]|nr:hypothetical protein [Pirellulales bacterium]